MTSQNTHTFDLLAHFLRQNHSCQLQCFGEFQVIEVSSHVDPDAQLFHPMGLEPVFVQSNKPTSEDFISYCSSVWACSYQVSENKIKEQLIESGNYLSNEGSFTIKGLGSFTKGSNAQIHFRKDAENWTSGISFGLTNIRFTPGANKVRTILVDRSAKPGDMEEISIAREQALRELRLMLEQANIAESGKSQKKIGAFPIIATILTLILLINVILFLKKNPTSTIQTEIAKMDMASETGNLIKDSVNPIFETDQLEVENSSSSKNYNPGTLIKRGEMEFDSNDYFPIIDLNVIPNINELNTELKSETNSESLEDENIEMPIEKAVINATPSAPVINKIKENKGSNASFSLVAGAFKSIGNAEKLERELKSQGYKNASVLKPKNHIYFLVFYESFSKREEAMKLQTQLENKGEEPWIFEAE